MNLENGLFARRDHAARGRLCVLYYEPCGSLSATSPEGMWRLGYLTESEARSSVRGNALFFVLLFFPVPEVLMLADRLNARITSRLTTAMQR